MLVQNTLHSQTQEGKSRAEVYYQWAQNQNHHKYVDCHIDIQTIENAVMRVL